MIVAPEPEGDLYETYGTPHQLPPTHGASAVCPRLQPSRRSINTLWHGEGAGRPTILSPAAPVRREAGAHEQRLCKLVREMDRVQNAAQCTNINEPAGFIVQVIHHLIYHDRGVFLARKRSARLARTFEHAPLALRCGFIPAPSFLPAALLPTRAASRDPATQLPSLSTTSSLLPASAAGSFSSLRVSPLF